MRELDAVKNTQQRQQIEAQNAWLRHAQSRTIHRKYCEGA